jgi:hypothetical protein
MKKQWLLKSLIASFFLMCAMGNAAFAIYFHSSKNPIDAFWAAVGCFSACFAAVTIVLAE